VVPFLEQFTYLGIFLVLLAASLGVPIPEELPVITAGVLAHEGVVRWWLAVAVCLAGVVTGDILLYWAGYRWGERVLDWRVVRRVLSREREERLMASYRRHGVKIVFVARHLMGVRAAAFLTAGIARVPFWKFLLVDGSAALVSVPLGFGLGFLFTDQLERVLADVHRVERWLALAAVAALAAGAAVLAWRRGRVPVRRGASDVL
jgi:membrane protein DedA with SNARE-associated domain